MYTETARRLKEALDRMGYTQQELAELSGVGKASISQYINGSHAPGNISAHKMAKCLGVSAEYLMGFEEKKYDKTDTGMFSKMMLDPFYEDLIVALKKLDKDQIPDLVDYANYLINKRRGT